MDLRHFLGGARAAICCSISLAIVAACAGCDAEQVKQWADAAAQQLDQTPAKPASLPAARAGNSIQIATFNIQVFGKSKMSKPAVMDVLTKIVRRYDIVAIQEIRAQDDTILPRFVDMLNADGAHYDFVIGERLGRTNSTEQYAYVFDTATIEVDPQSVYTVPDPKDLLHREPLVARFRARGAPSEHAFTFTLVNIHTDPDEVKQELDVLDDVFRAVKNNGSGEEDVIILGDLNVDEYHMGEFGKVPNIDWVVRGTTTNTRRKEAYDNIVFSNAATVEYTGAWGVLDIMQEYGLTLDQALAVSDHLPVWAQFSVYEGQRGPLAARDPDSVLR